MPDPCVFIAKILRCRTNLRGISKLCASNYVQVYRICYTIALSLENKGIDWLLGVVLRRQSR